MSGTQPNAKRRRPMVTVTLSPEAVDRLDELARRSGASKSAIVEALIRGAEMPRTQKRPDSR